jgi:hypothetical protein
MRRFTILGVMGLVLVLAVGLAALRGANDYWAGGLLTFTPLLFGLATIGALCGRPERRPRRIGFVVLGGGYFALAFLGLSDANLGKLPTSRLMLYAHQRVGVPEALALLANRVSLTGSPTGYTLVDVSGSMQGSTALALDLGTPILWQDLAAGLDDSTPPGAFSWRAVLPGAANYGAFSAVGHCLFALMAGAIGAFVGRRCATSQVREAARASATGRAVDLGG